MSTALKACLLSAFVAPGAGHFYLKKRALACLLLAISLLSIITIAWEAAQLAQTVLQQLEREGVSLEISRIQQVAAQAAANADSHLVTLATYSLIACWLFGLIDSYRLGKKNHRE